MEIGLLIPQGYFNEFDGWEPRRAWERMVAIAEAGEALGFGSIWLGEHVVAKWDPEGPAFDGVTAMVALAALVPRVELGFVVVNSTLRSPAMTAKMASTLDTISAGRLILGLGAGFKENEAAWAGVPFPPAPQRLRLLGEHLEVITRMTRRDEAVVTYRGEHIAIEQATNSPRTGGRDHIPVLIGGHGRSITFRLAARYADEVNIDVMPHELADYRETLFARCEQIGRDPATMRVAAGLNPCWPYSDLTVTAGQRMMTQADLPDVMKMTVDVTASRVEEIAAWRELGIDRLVCGAPGLAHTDESLYELVEHLEQAAVPLQG